MEWFHAPLTVVAADGIVLVVCAKRNSLKPHHPNALGQMAIHRQMES